LDGDPGMVSLTGYQIVDQWADTNGFKAKKRNRKPLKECAPSECYGHTKVRIKMKMNENGLANKLFNENRTEKLEKKFRKKIQKVKTLNLIV
jgi:hypothetical protein